MLNLQAIIQLLFWDFFESFCHYGKRDLNECFEVKSRALLIFDSHLAFSWRLMLLCLVGKSCLCFSSNKWRDSLEVTHYQFFRLGYYVENNKCIKNGRKFMYKLRPYFWKYTFPASKSRTICKQYFMYLRRFSRIWRMCVSSPLFTMSFLLRWPVFIRQSKVKIIDQFRKNGKS